MGNEILSNKELLEQAGEPLCEIKKEKWTSTKYKNFEKSPDFKSVYAERQDEWEQACDQMTKPTKNRFVPENLETITNIQHRKKLNRNPKRIRFDNEKDDKRIDLYHLVDEVHLKPMT